MASKNKTYFAARSSLDLAGYLDERQSDHHSSLSSSGLIRRMKRSYNYYYGKHFGSGASNAIGAGYQTEIHRYGDKGEYAAFAVNHYRNLIRHILNMTVTQKVTFDVRAVNSDSDSIEQARLGSNILDAYFRQKRLARYNKRAAEFSQVMGKGFVFPQWKRSLGKPIGVQPSSDPEGNPVLGKDGQPSEQLLYEGDIDACTPSPFDIVHDLNKEDFANLDEVEIRTWENKFDLAVQYPHAAEKILDLATKSELDSSRFFTFQKVNESCDIPVYYFFHRRTLALPNGRLMIRCDRDTVLYDGPIPYSKLPLFRIVPGEVLGTTQGYTDAFDLMALQEATNVVVSTAFSNVQAHGLSKVYVPNGVELSNAQISKGLAIWRGPPGLEPKAINLTANPKDVFELIPGLQKMMETVSGINSVVRGDPEHTLKSGVAIALVQAMAVQYASDFQQSWAELNEDTGTFYLLDCLKPFAKTKRMVAMAGKSNRGYMAAFSGDDLSKIERVVVDLGNPMARTLSGRMQLAETYSEKGWIQNPQEYESVIESGSIEPMTEGIHAQLALIRQEKEFLMDGKPVKAVPGDKHLLHATEHMAILANPEVRLNAPTVQAILQHVQEHKQLWMTQDSFFAQISGEPPPPPPPPPPMPPQVPPPGTPPGGPPHGPPPGGPPGPMQPGGLPPHPGPPPHGPHGHPPHHGGKGPPLGSQLLQPPMQMQPVPHLPPQLQPPQIGNPVG